MFSALLIIIALAFTDLGKLKGLAFRPLSRVAFWVFTVNFVILMVLGAKHVESPYIELGQISTILYFSYFILIVPLLSIVENILVELSLNTSKINSTNPVFTLS